jgi:hypothetical protein
LTAFAGRKRRDAVITVGFVVLAVDLRWLSL